MTTLWDVDADLKRRELIVTSLQNATGYLHLDDLAISLDRLAQENNGDLWLSTGKDFHNSRFRRILSADIDHINRTNDYPCVIVSNNNGVKIASKSECAEMIRKERREAIKKLAKISVITHKLDLDGQLTITAEEVNNFKEE